MSVLEIEHLTKTYPNGERALKGIDITVEGHEVIALLGLSGSGKSTLLRCINRLVEPTSGRIVLGGVDVTRLGKRHLRRTRARMGMIFQEFNLIDRLTVIENVLSGTLGTVPTWRGVFRAFQDADVQRALALCERVGILDHVRKRADQLSGGQRQRVGIARALMQDPKILLVDEPTSSLDPKIGREVMDLLTQVAFEAQVPMLVSVHDVHLARHYSDRIVGLRSGEKIFDQPTDSLEPDSLERVYRMAS